MLYLETIIPNIELCTLNFDKYYHEHCSPQHNVINGENGLYSLIVAIQSVCVKIDKLSSSVCACSAYKHSMKDISQRFWLFSKCHCQNTYIDMDIPQISACRGISVAAAFSECPDTILSIKSLPVASHYFHILNVLSPCDDFNIFGYFQLSL